MTSKERYLRVIKNQSVDFVPRIPILMQFAAEYIGSNYAAFASDYRVLVDSNMRCAHDFGFDQLSAISDPYRETQGFGADIEYQTNGVPKCLVPPLEVSKDLALLKNPDPLRSERMLDRVKAIRSYKELCGDEYSILGWIEGPAAEAADLRGVMNFLIDTMTDVPFAEELMQRCVDVGIDFARAQLQAGAETIGIGDAIASQVSPDVYENLILPREKKLVDGIKAEGGFVRLHICGDITHLLPGIATLDIDILDIDHIVDMAQARKIVGDKIVLAGNIDPVAGVRNSDPASIRKKIAEIYKSVDAPFMVNAGCEIPVGTPFENVRALCEPVRP